MNQSRRAFIKTAIAIPAAGAAGAVSLSCPAKASGTLAEAAQVTAKTEYPWRWWVSYDKEIYREDFGTQTEALEYAKKWGYTYIAECKQQDFDISVDGYDIIERLNDNNFDLIGEGEGIDCTSEQARDLESMVEAAIEAWVVKHKISLTAWTFAGVRNVTQVPEPETSLSLSSREDQ